METKKSGFKKIILCTNGYELSESDYVEDLKLAGLIEAQLDIKCYDKKVHIWYTGKSNIPVLKAIKNLNNLKVDLIIQTVYIPEIVEKEEIKRISIFLSDINPDIKYRINPFEPKFSYERISRTPHEEELRESYEIAKSYLKNTILSMSCRREFAKNPKKGKWVTVYPDLSFERRGVEEYEHERISRLQPL